MCNHFNLDRFFINFSGKHRENHGNLRDKVPLSITIKPQKLETLEELKYLLTQCSKDEQGIVKESMFYYSVMSFSFETHSTFLVPCKALDGDETVYVKSSVSNLNEFYPQKFVLGMDASHAEIERELALQASDSVLREKLESALEKITQELTEYILLNLVKYSYGKVRF